MHRYDWLLGIIFGATLGFWFTLNLAHKAWEVDLSDTVVLENATRGDDLIEDSYP